MTLRVIGGTLKGRKLITGRGTTTRPTADRIRESIFNIISARICGAVVLDLFAGTGAFGIEALSRGAERATFIERHKPAVSIIEKNIESCGLSGSTRIIQWNILKNLNCIKSSEPAFGMIFMDPPYNQATIAPSLLNLRRSGSIAPGAVIVVEHDPQEPVCDNDMNFKVKDRRTYGKTVVSILNYVL